MAHAIRRLSIATQLYLVVGVMTCLIGGELAILSFAMGKLSAARAFVEGEALWSKAQKDAVFSLQRYAVTHDEEDYRAFLAYLKIPDGDHRARVALEKTPPDLDAARRGFLDGGIHPEDIDPMIDLLRRFSWISYLDRAVGEWRRADELLDELRGAARDYRVSLLARPPDHRGQARAFGRIREVNADLTRAETAFSVALGEGSRWLERVLLSLLFGLVLTVEAIGLTLTFRTGRRISRGLADLNRLAERIGRGEFPRAGSAPDAEGEDEIGRLADSIHRMGGMLETVYRDLERRVEDRTRELARLAEENARLYARTHDTLVQRDEFISIASHELKTPLTALFLQLQLLERMPTAQPVVPKVQRALQQARRSVALIDLLLDLARARAGRLDLDCRYLDLRTVVQDAISQQTGSGAALIRLHPGEPIPGQFDATRVTQVVSNLLTNAIKYGQQRPIDVWVERGDGERARIRVRDQGIGIAAREHHRVFQRFERLQSRVSGLGLGLYISREIVERHGGRIRVQSEEGQGAEFIVELPIDAPAEAQPSGPAQ